MRSLERRNFIFGVKLWFTKMLFVGFYSVSNLIIILFNLMYHVFVVGIYCKGCVIVWESVKTQASYEKMHVPHTWLECEDSVQIETSVSREYLAGKAFPRDTRETFCSARLYYLIHTFCTYTIYIHITHKW